MAKIETKYNIGDTVFHACTMTEQKKHPCPDCLGSRKWKAVSPAGTEYEFACPRCSTSYLSDRDIALDYVEYVPSVLTRTIGSVRFDSGRDDHPVEYMCVETGVGSGSIYSETDLYPTREEAMEAALAKAKKANTSVEWVAKLYDKSLRISDYQLESAKIKLADDARSEISGKFWNVGYLLEQIEEADDKDAILELVDFYKQYDWQRDKDRFAEAVEEHAAA